ncbi:MAG: hypothetical protein OEY34_08740, partial [Cyclobacteriaceae bacterium]|nr:hypothetical protein [Cyclobacteriaceae bacterium]
TILFSLKSAYPGIENILFNYKYDQLVAQNERISQLDSTININLINKDLIIHWNTSLQISYSTFLEYVNENPKKFIDDTYSKHRFFLSFAHANRALIKETNTFNTLKYSKISINQILSNNEGFYSTFKIQESNTMYIPDSSKFTQQLIVN